VDTVDANAEQSTSFFSWDVVTNTQPPPLTSESENQNGQGQNQG
jgi:hypothetical protein